MASRGFAKSITPITTELFHSTPMAITSKPSAETPRDRTVDLASNRRSAARPSAAQGRLGRDKS
jgi:hypothetical protein